MNVCDLFPFGLPTLAKGQRSGWNSYKGPDTPARWFVTSMLTFPQSHSSDLVRDSVAGEQDVNRSAGLRQKVQVHL